jgi:hypothetical protein
MEKDSVESILNAIKNNVWKMHRNGAVDAGGGWGWDRVSENE